MYPLAEGCFAPRNQWYIAAWADEIKREPMERWILNEPVALYRTEAGAAVALEGRCPHRHFPLGKSRVVGDNVECMYHGITFSPKGECVRIPSQGMVPNSCKVKSFPVVERWQWVWIWMGDPELADESLLPDHEALDLLSDEFHFETGTYLPVPGRYMLMHDNLFDLTHLGFLHQTSIGAGDFGVVDERRTNGDNWICSERDFPDIDCPPLFAKVFDYYGKVDRSFGMKLHLPCLHAGFDFFYKSRTEQDDPGALLGKVRVFHAITPGTHNSSHYFFAVGRSFKKDDAVFGQKLLENMVEVIGEDLLATREIEAMLGGLDAVPPEVLLKADATCVRGRRLFEAMIRKEQTA